MRNWQRAARYDDRNSTKLIMPSALQTLVRDLHRRNGRDRRGLTLAEGVRLVEEVIASGTAVTGVLAAPGLDATPRGLAVREALETLRISIENVSDAELDALADTDQPQGIVAVVRSPAWTLEQISLSPDSVILVLDGVQDPGNVGTMLRTCLGLGAAGVVALPGTAELGNPKVVRGSMGAYFRLPAVRVQTDEFIAWIHRNAVTMISAMMEGTPVSRFSPRKPCALIVGNEGAGIRAELAATGERVTIPLAHGAESLNVGVAAGILLYEVMRDR